MIRITQIPPTTAQSLGAADEAAFERDSGEGGREGWIGRAGTAMTKATDERRG